MSNCAHSINCGKGGSQGIGTLQDNNRSAHVLGFLWWQLLQLPALTERGLLEAQMHVGQELCCQDPKQTVCSMCVLPSDSGKRH